MFQLIKMIVIVVIITLYSIPICADNINQKSEAKAKKDEKKAWFFSGALASNYSITIRDYIFRIYLEVFSFQE